MQSAMIPILFPLIVKAAFNDDARAVGSAADALSGSVAAFDKGQGIAGALGIQGYFPTLSSAVDALAGDAKSVTDADVDASTVQSFVTSVINLLDALTKKSADVQAVAATQIVSLDISSISSPAGEIVSDVVKALQSDCGKLNSITDVIKSLEAAFSSAGSVYSVAPPSFPELSCAGVGAASSSAPASLAAESSKPAVVSSKASGSAPSYNGTGSLANGTTTTVPKTAYVTIPCESTTLTYGGKTYTVSDNTTLTVSDCSCPDNAHVTKPASSKPAAATRKSAASPAASSPAHSVPHVANAGAKAAVAVPAAVAGAVFMML